MKVPPYARSLPGVLFGSLVILLALVNSWPGVYPFGHAVWIRPIVGAVGILGAICLFCGSGWWRLWLPVWCLCQSFIIATDVSGEWFYQGLMLGVQRKSSGWAKINEMVTSYSARGMNTTGLVLLIVVGAIAFFRLHPPIRRKISLKQPVFVIPVIVLAAVAAFAALRHRGESDAIYVLDVDVPNVPIYYKDQLLGRTPLQITPARLAAWKLPLDAAQHLTLFAGGWADCVQLSDGKTSLPLYAAAPWPFASYLDRFDTPWGERCRMHIGGEHDNRRDGFLYPAPPLRHEPVLTIQMLDAPPIPAGAPLRLNCVLTNPTSKGYVGRLATMERHCFFYDQRNTTYAAPAAGARRAIDMPAAWNALPAGATLKADLGFDAPVDPGDYELFCTWFLFKAGDNTQTGVGSVYSNMLWLRVGPPVAAAP